MQQLTKPIILGRPKWQWMLFILLSFSSFKAFSQPSKLQVYTVDTREKDKETDVQFISMSDFVHVIEHPDSALIPIEYIGLSGNEVQERVELIGEFRNLFFKRAHLTEHDSLFIYNCKTDNLTSFALKELSVVGFVTNYWGSNDNNIREYEYQIGFEVEGQQVGGFAYFGSKNPFAQGKMQALTWEEIASDLFPSEYNFKRDVGRLPKVENGPTFKGEVGNLVYYLQNTAKSEWASARRLAVMNKHTKELVFQSMLYTGESADFAPLNGIQTEEKDAYVQWAGQLFKNQPDVIFGFMWQSFGCPAIYIMNQNFDAIYIGCDNRH
jgi:hypothetical protein